MRVVRVYHAGRSEAHRARERALAAAGLEVTLLVPSNWREGGSQESLTSEPFRVVELPVSRPDDVNRHRYASAKELTSTLFDLSPDLIDVHEEPFSAAMHQVLACSPPQVPVVGYSAQNLDKRYPPPFNAWERTAYANLRGMYPCSRQAASVLRSRGYFGVIRVLELGIDATQFRPGGQTHEDQVWTVALVGRLVPEKGVRDALIAFSHLTRVRDARLVIVGSGPLQSEVPRWAHDLGISSQVEIRPWASSQSVAELYRRCHAVVVPSRATSRWVEQFGRMVVEAQACGAVVVGYASGSIGEVSSGAGMLLAEGDVLGLSRALADLAAYSEGWQRLRTMGVRLAGRCHWERVAARQIDFYEDSLREPFVSRARRRVGRGPVNAEFGATALAAGGVSRPFAVPVLRNWPWLARAADSFDRLALRKGGTAQTFVDSSG